MRCSGTEEPDWAGNLGDFQCVNTDNTRVGIIRHEWRRETILLGHRVELLSARVGKRRLGNCVVTTAELKVDEIANCSCDYLRSKDETSSSAFRSTDDDRDVCS